MIRRTRVLSISRQCQLLDLARSTAYTKTRPITDEELDLMQRMGRIHSSHPTMGQGMIRDTLNNDGIPIGRQRVRTLMNRMGIRAHCKHPIWRSVKYEEVYQRAYTDMRDARNHLGRYIDIYNSGRPHRAHGGKSPDSIDFEQCNTQEVA